MERPLILVIYKNQEEQRELENILGSFCNLQSVSVEKVDVAALHNASPALILMSGDRAGLVLMEQMKEDNVLQAVPVILMLDEQGCDSERQALQMGADEFIRKPFLPEIVQLRVERILERENLRKGIRQEREKKENQINQFSMQSLMTIAHTIDAKDRFAKGQSVRVALCCREIASRLGWGEKEISDLYNIALIHDIGNVAIEDAILNKTTPLTEEEYDSVKQHTMLGEQIVKNTRVIPGLEEGVRYHHERYDGKGYDGLQGEKIPQVARIIAVADAYAAMTSDRPYRKRLPEDKVMEELKKGRGSQFDPAIVDVMLRMIREGIELDETMVEEDAVDNGIGEMGALLRHVFTESVQESQSELEKDSLTGFLTRQYFEDKINNYLMDKNARGTFFMMDLDNFKSVNDIYGHTAGDKLILSFADVLKENVRDRDFVCRMGGDEFAIFFPGMDKESVIRERAEAIMKLFLEKRRELGYEECSVSIGVMTRYAGGKEATCQELYDCADKALYFAKNNGKDDYYLYNNLSKDSGLNSGNAEEMNLGQLMHQIEERKYRTGAYSVEYDRFAYIFQFVARNIERSKQQVQIILMTLRTEEEKEVSVETVEDSLMLLETAIIHSLRRGDVTTRFSTTQQIIILMDVNQDDGVMVAERIMKKYKDLSAGNRLQVKYDITEVPVSDSDKEH